jgi:protein SCO1/2
MGMAASAGHRCLKAGTFDPAARRAGFFVNGTDGAPLTLSHYRGKVVVLAFGYTSCPNVCPVTLAVLAQAHRKPWAS